MVKLRAGHSRAVVCTDLIPTGEFARNPDWGVDASGLAERLRARLGDRVLLLEGQRLATALMGDAIAANMFMLGASWQLGQIPLSLASIDRAIELNGVAIDMNRQAFLWGRRAAHDLASVERSAVGTGPAAQVIRFTPRATQSLDELVRSRSAYLTEYQNGALAQRYTALVERVRSATQAQGLDDSLARAVARYWFKLLAPKDEWEVARLYSRPEFRQELERVFEGDYRLHFHIGAWPFVRTHPTTGKPVKREVGPWLMNVFSVMAKLRFLRGSLLDPFRNSAERRLERALVERYEADVVALLSGLNAHTLPVAVQIASLPEKIRGFGHVKEANAAAAATERESLLTRLRAPADAVRTVAA